MHTGFEEFRENLGSRLPRRGDCTSTRSIKEDANVKSDAAIYSVRRVTTSSWILQHKRIFLGQKDFCNCAKRIYYFCAEKILFLFFI